MNLYPWQKECIKAWQANHYRGMVNAITGTGKTFMALYGIRFLENHLPAGALRVKVVVPTFALTAQWALAMQYALPDCKSRREKPGVYHSDQADDPNRKYMIYIINSARYTLARHILADIKNGYAVLLIADECHHCASPENRKIFDFLSAGIDLTNKYFSLGLSATPQVLDYDTVLVPALGKEIYRYGFSEAVRKNNICKFFIYQIALSFSPEELQEYQELTDRLAKTRQRLLACNPSLKYLDRFRFFGALKQMAGEKNNTSQTLSALYLNLSCRRQALNHMASSRLSCLQSLIRQLDERTRIIVFGERIKQAEMAYRLLSRQYPNQVGCYHSQMDGQARKNALARFHDGNQRILISCRALDEGIDVPDATVGIVLSGSSVGRQRTQRLGRILRKQSGKHAACLYYFYVRESTEDSVFLSDQEENAAVCDLFYSATEDAFIHPDYEAAAAAFLDEITQKESDESFINEIRCCLLAGLVRSDWLLSPDVCREKAGQAGSQREKNYWICMRRMAMRRNNTNKTRFTDS